MPRSLRTLVVAALACAGLLAGAPAAAADEDSDIGYDVSHPQCDADLPERAAFGIVGVNGGLPTRANPCLAEQLAWAEEATGEGRGQPGLQLYVNTANPGQLLDLVHTWPLAGDSPHGHCDGDNSAACSWRYGWLRAYLDVEAFFGPAAEQAGVDPDPAAHRWWLDVETMNTWQYGSPVAQDRNRAVLEGMTDYLTGRGAEVGLYSTGQQWRRIVGDVPRTSVLYDLDSWLAGADDETGARATCRRSPLVDGGEVVLTQYVDRGLDHNHVCD
ncbi:hypothetical protein [Geodermatophilus sp. CPCC 206100]|uniref:hypothetical protein n=1 Tax=Geodermatophilus sp. CPCC 206100 TaxID=3020054 RepID=UPI003AFFB9C8